MATFLIILGALVATNFVLLRFSCNDSTDSEIPDDE